MQSEEKKYVPVDVVILLEVQKKVLSQNLKISTTLKSHYLDSFPISEYDVHTLMELKISSNMIRDFLEELISDAKENNSKSVQLTSEEVEMLATIVRSIEIAFCHNLSCGTNLAEH